MDKILNHFSGRKIIQRGLEREALRIDSKGYLSKKKHPVALGASLTNKYITTDYSEALLELVTPIFNTASELYDWSAELHKFCIQNIDGEYLWPLSMPCVLEGADQIPIADFGSSNVGKMKQLYRVGLSYRYGSAMQVIAGIHYNFSLNDDVWQHYWKQSSSALSLQDFKSHKYMGLVRNFMRMGWIIPYLFGASPAACKSFLQGDLADYPFLKQKDSKLIYGDYATSLRMSDLGYRNFEQDTLNIRYNDLNQYLFGLVEAIRTPFPRWQEIDQKANGKLCQLNDSILQIENEYYGMMRPKQVAKSGESPSLALLNRGIQYVEMRSVDINPFDPNGLSIEQMKMLDLILLTCLRQSDDYLDEHAEKELKNNFNQVVLRGRDPQLLLSRNGQSISVADWGGLIVEELKISAACLDDADYDGVVENYATCFKNPDLTLSGRLISKLHQQCYCGLGMDLAKEYQLIHKQPQRLEQIFEIEAVRSHNSQEEIERFDRVQQVSFADYLDKYYRATLQCLSNDAKSIYQN